MTEERRMSRGYAIGVASAVALSTTGVLIRYLTVSHAMPPMVLAFWRNFFVTVTLGAVLSLDRPGRLRVPLGQLGYLVGYGFLLAVFNGFYTFSVALNGAAVGTVLVYSSAAFTAVLGRVCLGERLGWAKVSAIGLSLAGCVLVTGAYGTGVDGSSVGAAGIVTGALSGLLYAVYSLMGRTASSQRQLDSWTTLLYTFGSAACVQLLLNLLPGTGPAGAAGGAAGLFMLGRAGGGWLALFILGAGPTLVGFGLYNLTLSYLPTSAANLLLTLEVPCAAFIAFLALGETLTAQQVLGSVLILAGVVLLRLSAEGGRFAPARYLRPRSAGGTAPALEPGSMGH
ncbi:MAG: DMT family transporter [Bacillota bacterium]